jgi:hypothetical protein
MQTQTCWLLTLLLGAASARMGAPVIPRSQLRITGTTVVQGMMAKPTLGPLRCDRQGNVYLRFYAMGAVLGAPVVRISADGEAKQEFSLASVPGFQQASVDAFAVAPDGEVGLAVWGPKVDDGNILMFKTDGTSDSDATINMGPKSTFQMAVFSNGNLLVSGTKGVKLYGRREPSVSAPFNEVLNDAGDVLKDIALPGDYAPPKPSDPAFEKSLKVQPAEITLGDAISGTDGNVYLTRHFGDPTVYVIASDGSLVKKLRLDPPVSGAQSHGGIHFSSEGRLAMEFTVVDKESHVSTRVISVYSAETGERLADYETPREVGSGFACYTPNGFTFLGSNEQHQLVINQVRPY